MIDASKLSDADLLAVAVLVLGEFKRLRDYVNDKFVVPIKIAATFIEADRDLARVYAEVTARMAADRVLKGTAFGKNAISDHPLLD